MDNSSSRRRFLQTLGLATGALAAGSFANAQEVAPLAPKKIIVPDPNNIGPMTTWPPRKPGAIYMGGFRAPKLDKVRVAFVGVGERGSMHVGQMAVIEGAEVVGICDLYKDWAERNAALVEKKTGKRPPIFTNGPEDYKRMMKEVKPDAVPRHLRRDENGRPRLCGSPHGRLHQGTLGNRQYLRGNPEALHDDGKRQLRT